MDGDDDDDPAHRGHAFLLHTVRVYALVALRLTDPVPPHPLDEILPEPYRNDQRQYQCEQGTERDVGPHVRTRNTVFAEESEKIV